MGGFQLIAGLLCLGISKVAALADEKSMQSRRNLYGHRLFASDPTTTEEYNLQFDIVRWYLQKDKPECPYIFPDCFPNGVPLTNKNINAFATCLAQELVMLKGYQPIGCMNYANHDPWKYWRKPEDQQADFPRVPIRRR